MSNMIKSILYGVVCWLPLLASASPYIACHYTYGGESKTHLVQPTKQPYDIAPIQIGSYFTFRVVWQTEPSDLAHIKIYTYADQEQGQVLIQQVSYPYPLPATSTKGYGFTGKQRVYEPIRDGELEYWCELDKK